MPNRTEGPRPRPAALPRIEPLEARLLLASDFLFPSDAGVINVLDYGALPNDDIDDTAAIQAAINAATGNKIAYLPNGVYIISDTLKWPSPYTATNLYGQSQAGTIIKLRDNAAGYQDPSKHKAMIWTGTGSADRFRNHIHYLTVDTGSGNPGAAGIQYMSNNEGSMRHVTIRSGDGQGVIGLDMAYTDMIGPLMISDVTVIGFDYGIKTGHTVNSMTLSNVTVREQGLYGLYNNGQVVTVEGLTSINTVTAVYNGSGSSMMTLISSTFTGTGGASSLPAVVNAGGMFARAIATSGYASAIDNTGGHGLGEAGPYVCEFVSHGIRSLFPSPQVSLNLPVNAVPEVPDDPLGPLWDGPTKHQSGTSGWPNDGKDDTAAIQAAIDSGASTIYLPAGTWNISGTIYIRGNVKRVIGMHASLSGTATIVFQDTTPDVMIWERIHAMAQKIRFENARSKPLILRDFTMGWGGFENTSTGDIYLDDVVGGPWVFHNCNVWARQFNSESQYTKITNDGAALWILGLKTERPGTQIHTLNGGKTELLGCFAYSLGGTKTMPMFVNDESSVSIVAGEANYNSPRVPFTTAVAETRGGQTRYLMLDENFTRLNGNMMVLYVGYQPADATPPAVETVRAVTSANKQVVLRFTEPLDAATAQNKANYTIAGKSISSAVLASDGKTVTLTTTTSLAGGVNYTVEVRNVRDQAANAIVPVRKAFHLAAPGDGLTGQYFDNSDLTNLKTTRVDASINFNWGDTIPSGTGITHKDTWSVRWSGYIVAEFSESYTFYAFTDDGVRYWIDGQEIATDWANGSNERFPIWGGIALAAGVKYPITVEYYENTGSALAILQWMSANTPMQVVGQSCLFSSAVNELPLVSAGLSQTVRMPGAILAGEVGDDGLGGGALSCAWSKVSGPGSVSFGDPSSPATTATFSTPGTYVLRLTADDGALAAYDEVTIVVSSAVNTAPVAVGEFYEVLTNGTLNVLTGLLANDSDADGDGLSAVLVSGASNGAVRLGPDGWFVYYPNAGYAGGDSFTYKVSDAQLYSSSVTVELAVGIAEGDVNWDLAVNAADIDSMFAALAAASTHPRYDLDGDGSVSRADLDKLVREIFGGEYGDINLDGAVDAADLDILAANWLTGTGWATGDVNGDGKADLDDLIVLANHWSWTEALVGASAATSPAEQTATGDAQAEAVSPAQAFLAAAPAAQPRLADDPTAATAAALAALAEKEQPSLAAGGEAWPVISAPRPLDAHRRACDLRQADRPPARRAGVGAKATPAARAAWQYPDTDLLALDGLAGLEPARGARGIAAAGRADGR